MSECMWCDDGWPMSRNPGQEGCHEIEAEGQYAPVPCRRIEEYGKFEAKRLEEENARVLWEQVCREVEGYEARNSRYVELLREHGLITAKGDGTL